MKILTWNINGIRAARRDKSLKAILDSLEAEVICLQETKVTRDMLDEVTAIVEGYNAYFSFSKVKTGYSGVATFCRDAVTPVAAEEGLSSVLTPQPSIGCYDDNKSFTPEELEALDAEGRAVLTEHTLSNDKTVVIINVYCPRADKENKERVNFKLDFYRLLEERAKKLFKSGRHVIVLGDVNTAHKMIDHCDPDEKDLFNANPGRQWLNRFLLPIDVTSDSSLTCNDPAALHNEREPCFIDTFRYFYPAERGAYTNWCTVTSARQTNYGTRIDYIFADFELVKKEFVDCVIRSDIDGSDHCPVVATLKTGFKGASKPPLLCTKFMPEFAGKQQKLKSYFVSKAEQPRSSSQPSRSCSNGETKELKSFLKRSASFEDEKTKVKRQKCGVTKAPCPPKRDLLTFFSKSSKSIPGDREVSKASDASKSLLNSSRGSDDKLLLKAGQSSLEKQTREDIPCDQSVACKDRPQKRKCEAALWKNILTGPRPAPLCKGHKEPCVLRTVKVKGPNQGKQFYCCAKPQGHSSNPQARCNFFEWVNK
ncbi:PREDICTED: DNA-(apurinic or apyrimidinic site) lyase 2-like [Acropora digitifera]|uniref:DNA-(apurinic or apyrimidinic site) lyase 2-like n=1 Tax=Acropora digitifera TaxID=70779 RepID=UPI00077B1CBF|nr:PREDICTED: DNA-(apurinic or apyrimidinic site) lyase 2-like [Acropora digitifera]